MIDYSELVKSLRICVKSTDCIGCIKNADGTEYGCKPLGDSELVLEAADAIEELSMKLHGDEAAIAGMKGEIERMVVEDKPRWIPVTERLPSENDRYLTVSIEPWFGMTVVDTMRWSGVWMYDGRQTEAKVTHWMPLPQAPKEEQE